MSNYLVNTLHFNKAEPSEKNEGKKPKKLTEALSDEALSTLVGSLNALRENLPDLLEQFREMGEEYTGMYGRQAQPGRPHDMPGWDEINTAFLIMDGLGWVEGDLSRPESVRLHPEVLQDLQTLANVLSDITGVAG